MTQKDLIIQKLKEEGCCTFSIGFCTYKITCSEQDRYLIEVPGIGIRDIAFSPEQAVSVCERIHNDSSRWTDDFDLFESKKTVKQINENRLKQIVAETVRKTLKEYSIGEFPQDKYKHYQKFPMEFPKNQEPKDGKSWGKSTQN